VLVIKSIRSQWLASLPDKSNSQQGKVTVSFTILPNGSVSNIKILQTDLPIKFETLAQKAIQQAEPFPVWSPAIKQLLNADELHMMFTFEYKPS
jgi:TonB family protein